MFVYENKKFVKLPDDERGFTDELNLNLTIYSFDSLSFLGQFYSQDSYLFVARYLLPTEDESLDNSEFEEEIKDSDTERIVYFWQGRNANNTAWFSFNFTYDKFHPVFPFVSFLIGIEFINLVLNKN